MSLTAIETWVRQRAAGGFALTSPLGPRAGMMRVRSDRPARPLVEYLPPGGPAQVRRVSTRRGELAAIGWSRHPDRLYGAAGIVGAARFTLVKGMCDEGAEMFVAVFSELVSNLDTGDDPLRRRMYLYAPPRGWSGRRLAFSSRWFPPDCPRDQAHFEVVDAVPLDDRAGMRTLDLIVDRTGPRLVEVKADGRFRYELHHVDPQRHGRHQVAFEQLVASLEHLPAPVANPGGSLEWLV